MKYIKKFSILEAINVRFSQVQSEPTELEFGDIVRIKKDSNFSDNIKKFIYQVEATKLGMSKLVNLIDSDYLGWIRNSNLELLSKEEIDEFKKLHNL